MSRRNSAASNKQHYDVTECIICADAYTDPRQLPCLHTFCLACIDSWKRDKQPGDLVDCPLCRRQFELPEHGLACLPRDRFVAKMLMVRRMSSRVASHLQCDVCRRSAANSEVMPAAKLYCVDCCESLCKPCAQQHRDDMTLANHELVKLRKRRPSRPEKLLWKLPVASCHRHSDLPREMYCLECSVTVCRRCLAADHKSHRAGAVEWLGDRLRDGILADIGRMERSVTRCRSDLERLRRHRDDAEARSDEAAASISAAAGQARAAVDNEERRLLDELTTSRTERARQLDNHIGACDLQVKTLDSFTRYCLEVTNKGSSSDVASAATKLKRRAAELLEFDTDRLTQQSSDISPEVLFSAADWLSADTSTLLGTLTLGDDSFGDHVTLPSAPPAEQCSKTTTLTKVIASRGRNSVCGIATDGNELFIARNNSAEIDVWDAETLVRQRLLPIPGLRSLYGFGYDVWGFTMCRQNTCLYVGYQMNVIRRMAIHRQGPRTSDSASKDAEWAVPGEAKGLSVSADRTVLVAIAGKCKLKELARQYLAEKCGGAAMYRCTSVSSQSVQSYLRRRLGRHDYDFVCSCLIYQLFMSAGAGMTQLDLSAYIESDDCKHALHEYSPEGQLVREISLPGDVTEPQHAVQLHGSKFVVSQAGSLHRVCVLRDDGVVETTYGRRRRRSGASQLVLNEPRDVAVDGAGRIFVADKDNKRIIVLDQTLSSGCELVLPRVEGGLNGPWSLCLDESRDRLYVGEWDGGRVLVFDHVSCVALK